MHNDQQYMRRCIELATRSLGYNQPNPEVGALIVHQNQIIGEGYHARYGNAHAEVNAVANVLPEHQHLLPHSTLYVTLEPCFHFGKTPPCVDLVLRTGFKRVVVGCQDPFEKVAGRSIEKMRQAGIEVTVGVLEQEIQWLNRRFFTQCQQQRPYVILKYAVSKDGYMGIQGKNVRISNPDSQRLLHRWRSEESAILVGTNTALVDNPQLNNRLYPINTRQPLRLVIDRNNRLPRHLHLFDGSQPTLVFCQQKTSETLPNIQFAEIDFGANHWITQLLAVLHSQRIQSLLVEGGAQTLQSFIDAGLWDETRIFIGDHALGQGIAAPLLKQATLKEEKPLGNNVLQIWARGGRVGTPQ